MFKKISNLLSTESSLGQTIFKNTFWLSVSEISGRLIRALLIIYAARVLGTHDFGIISYALSVSALFAIFAEMGLSGLVTREGSKNPEMRGVYFSTALSIKTTLTIMSALAMLFGTKYLTEIDINNTLLYFVVALFIFDSLRGFSAGIFRAEEKIEKEAILNIVTQALVLIIGFWALIKFKSPESLAFAYALGSGLGLIFAIYLTRNYLKKFLIDFNPKIIKNILYSAWPYSVAGILGIIMLNTDAVMLGWFTDASAIGLYSAAQKPILLLYIIPSFIAGGFFSSFARFANTDKEKFRNMLQKSITSILLIALPITSGIFFLSQEIISLLYGEAYLGATSSLQILSLSILTTFPLSLIANAAFALNEQKNLIIFGVAGVILNAVLDFALIPIYGILGCAIATLVSQIISNTFLWMRIKHLNYFAVFPYLAKIILSTIIMSISLLILVYYNFSIILIIPYAIIIYFGLLIILKEKLLIEINNLFK